MKILLLCWRDSTHPQGGGSERYLERVGEYLVSRGHDVIFRTSRHMNAARSEVRNGVKYSRGGAKYSVYPTALAMIAAGRLGIGPLRGVDVVVDTQNGIPFFARVVSGKPTVLLTHHCHREVWPVAGRSYWPVGLVFRISSCAVGLPEFGDGDGLSCLERGLGGAGCAWCAYH